jgi:hypothetical protein
MKWFLRYTKIKIEKEMLEEELIELKERMKEMLYRAVVVDPGENKRLKDELTRLRQLEKDRRQKRRKK